MNPILLNKTATVSSKKSPIRIFAIAAGAATILAFASSSCATSKGFGKDVEKVGDKIQNAAER